MAIIPKGIFVFVKSVSRIKINFFTGLWIASFSSDKKYTSNYGNKSIKLFFDFRTVKRYIFINTYKMNEHSFPMKTSPRILFSRLFVQPTSTHAGTLHKFIKYPKINLF